MNVMLMSAQSMDVGAVRSRFSSSVPSDACIVTVKPRSLLACSPMAGIAVTGVPLCRGTTFLMFWAQMVGNPVITPEPAAVFRLVRREGPVRFWLVAVGMESLLVPKY